MPSPISRLIRKYTVFGILLNVTIDSSCKVDELLTLHYQSFDGLNTGTIVHESLKLADATSKDVRKLLESNLVRVSCKGCYEPILFNKGDCRNQRQKDECEKCFTLRLKNQYLKLRAKDEAFQTKRDARMKDRGFTHRVVIWIRVDDEDDYEVEAYFDYYPSKEKIAVMANRRHSRVLNEYTVTEL